MRPDAHDFLPSEDGRCGRNLGWLGVRADGSTTCGAGPLDSIHGAAPAAPVVIDLTAVHEAAADKRATVTLFKPSGKYYTEETWRVPAGAIGPYDLERSPDFRRIAGGAVLVDSQEPWGYPHLFPSVSA